MPNILYADPRNWMACPLQRLHCLALRRIGLALQLEIGEDPVAPVALGGGERFLGQRNQSAPALARTLC